MSLKLLWKKPRAGILGWNFGVGIAAPESGAPPLSQSLPASLFPGSRQPLECPPAFQDLNLFMESFGKSCSSRWGLGFLGKIAPGAAPGTFAVHSPSSQELLGIISMEKMWDKGLEKAPFPLQILAAGAVCKHSGESRNYVAALLGARSRITNKYGENWDPFPDNSQRP